MALSENQVLLYEATELNVELRQLVVELNFVAWVELNQKQAWILEFPNCHLSDLG